MDEGFHRLSILVAEDSPPVLELIKVLLLDFGAGEVITASNGQDAFEKFCRHRPDLVIADWMMAPVNGIELTRMIRNDLKSPHMAAPVILITSYSEQSRVLEARDAGVTDFLVKPFNTRDLYRRVAQTTESSRAFVRSNYFTGPDRRYRDMPAPDPQGRRYNDPGNRNHLQS